MWYGVSPYLPLPLLYHPYLSSTSSTSPYLPLPLLCLLYLPLPLPYLPLPPLPLLHLSLPLLYLPFPLPLPLLYLPYLPPFLPHLSNSFSLFQHLYLSHSMTAIMNYVYLFATCYNSLCDICVWVFICMCTEKNYKSNAYRGPGVLFCVNKSRNLTIHGRSHSKLKDHPTSFFSSLSYCNSISHNRSGCDVHFCCLERREWFPQHWFIAMYLQMHATVCLW